MFLSIYLFKAGFEYIIIERRIRYEIYINIEAEFYEGKRDR